MGTANEGTLRCTAADAVTEDGGGSGGPPRRMVLKDEQQKFDVGHVLSGSAVAAVPFEPLRPRCFFRNGKRHHCFCSVRRWSPGYLDVGKEV